MKGLPGLACCICWGLGCGLADALPVEGPLRGVEPGISRPVLAALAASAGGALDCRDIDAIASPKAAMLQHCSARVSVDGQQEQGRIEVLLAPSAQGESRLVAIMFEADSSRAATVRDQLIRRWGEPSSRLAGATGAPDTLHWRLGARALVMSESCRGAQTFCIEDSDSSWARQAARAVGMAMALP